MSKEAVLDRRQFVALGIAFLAARAEAEQVLPVPPGAARALLDLPLPRHDKLIGVWLSNRSNVPTRLAIYERGGKPWMELRMGPQPMNGVESELVRTARGRRVVFRDRDPHEADVEADIHWVMNEDGALEWHGEYRLEERMVLRRR